VEGGDLPKKKEEEEKKVVTCEEGHPLKHFKGSP
jgi:hypothetical protein